MLRSAPAPVAGTLQHVTGNQNVQKATPGALRPATGKTNTKLARGNKKNVKAAQANAKGILFTNCLHRNPCADAYRTL